MAEYTIDKFSYGGNTYKLQDNVSGYTTNTGTVTSVGLSNASGESDFTIANTPVTTSGTITIKHSNTITAQTTQALYPIKFDKHGHITGSGSAVTVPTEVSELTNDIGYVTLGDVLSASANSMILAVVDSSGTTSNCALVDAEQVPVSLTQLLNAQTKQGKVFVLEPLNSSNTIFRVYNFEYGNMSGNVVLSCEAEGYRYEAILADSGSGLVGTWTKTQIVTPSDIPTVPTKVSDLTNDSNFTSVSFSRNLTSGTKVGTITIDGTSTDLYAPTDTDTKVTNTLATTTKYYMTGTTTASTNTGTQVFDSGIYATTTAGQLNATTYKVNEQVTLQWNSTDSGLDFIFA